MKRVVNEARRTNNISVKVRMFNVQRKKRNVYFMLPYINMFSPVNFWLFLMKDKYIILIRCKLKKKVGRNERDICEQSGDISRTGLTLRFREASISTCFIICFCLGLRTNPINFIDTHSCRIISEN